MRVVACGKNFGSVREFCNYFNINYNTVRSKLNSGLSYSEIVDDIYNIRIDGLSFRSFKDVADFVGLSYGLLNNRLSRGKDLLSSLILKPKGVRDAYYTEEGVSYLIYDFKSYKDMADYFKIPYLLFVRELNKTSSITKVLKLKGKKLDDDYYIHNPYEKSRGVEYRGISYNSLKHLCSELDLPYKTISGRVRSGCTLDDAINRGLKGRKKEVVAFGRKFESVGSLYSFYGVSCNCVRYRMSNGMSLEEAIEDILRKKNLSVFGM